MIYWMILEIRDLQIWIMSISFQHLMSTLTNLEKFFICQEMNKGFGNASSMWNGKQSMFECIRVILVLVFVALVILNNSCKEWMGEMR